MTLRIATATVTLPAAPFPAHRRPDAEAVR